MMENSAETPVYDLQERFIQFAMEIIGVLSELDSSRISVHLGGQLLRSGTAPALLYAEALALNQERTLFTS